MRPDLLIDQVWKQGSVHYKIVEIMSNGTMIAKVRNGDRGRWSAQSTHISPIEFNYLEFVKGPISEEIEDTPKTSFKRKIKKSNKYVITYAQNATPVHLSFLKSLLVYCEENKAELVVIPGRYRNPTSIWSKQIRHEEWWDEEIEPYIIDKRIQLADNLTAYGDISIQPTAIRPLTGMEVFTGRSSAIFGHPKIQLMTVATDSRKPKLMATTGSCTILNYTSSKAGKKAAAHHVFGATIVEIDKTGKFYLRQINAKHEDGSFIDLNWVYTEDGKYEAPPAEAVIFGDVHAENVEDLALKASFEMVDFFKAKKAVYHDVLDFRVRNHHNIDDFCDRFERASEDFEATDSIEKELKTTINIIESTPACAEPIIIASNHDEAFDKWLNNANPKTDPVNALLYYKMWVNKIEQFQQSGKWQQAFKLYYENEGYKRARFVDREDNCIIKGIVCGYHGDKGINGSRGNARAYAKLGVKTVIGHTHSPSITDGCYQVGVIGKLDQGYNHLPSSWAHANCVIYANGKRSLLFISPDTGEWKI